MDNTSPFKPSNELTVNASLCSDELHSPPTTLKSGISEHDAPLVARLMPGQVLYDIAEATLHKRAAMTGEVISQRHIFLEVNRIMVNSGFQDAHLKNVLHPTDADLPEQWNSVTNHTRLVLYTTREDFVLKHNLKHRKYEADKLKTGHGQSSLSTGRACLEGFHFGHPQGSSQ